MLKRDGKVYTQIVKNCSANELIPILPKFSELDESVIYSDCWKAYDGLVDYGAKRVRGKRGRGAANKTPVFLFRYAHSCKQTECLKETVGFILK